MPGGLKPVVFVCLSCVCVYLGGSRRAARLLVAFQVRFGGADYRFGVAHGSVRALIGGRGYLIFSAKCEDQAQSSPS